MALTPEQREERIQLWLLGHTLAQIAARQGVTPSAVGLTIRAAQADGLCPRERTREVVHERWGGHPRPAKYSYTCVVCRHHGTTTRRVKLYCGSACKQKAGRERRKQEQK